MAHRNPLALPRGWTRSARSSVLHSISLAVTALTRAWSAAATSRRQPTRLRGELNRAETEIAFLREELAIKDQRLRRIPPRRRPHDDPIQRMRILNLRSARRWNISQTANAFLTSELTIILWMQRLEEKGEPALLQLAEPVNKFPDFVRSIVRQLKTFFH